MPMSTYDSGDDKYSFGGGGGRVSHASNGHASTSETTVVISNRSTACTLHLVSGSSKESKSNTYTVQFNRTRTTEVTTPTGNMGKGRGTTSPVSQNSNASKSERAGTSSKPCCFCWCCCCSCSWIRRRCLSVKAPNGSLENKPDFIKDEELGNISATEVKSWGDSFERLMASETGRKVFRSFLRCEYSEENILFWLACEDLKQERSPELIEEKARIIYEDYVSILSPREVSLDSRVREIINRNMISPSQHTFDEAQLQIYTLMHRDSYPRFVNSTTYKDLLRTCGVSVESSSTSS